jgi:hypothetical protein
LAIRFYLSFALLQLFSGGMFFKTVSSDKENFAYNQRLNTLQQETFRRKTAAAAQTAPARTADRSQHVHD